jgi:hypothetical protein
MRGVLRRHTACNVDFEIDLHQPIVLMGYRGSKNSAGQSPFKRQEIHQELIFHKELSY